MRKIINEEKSAAIFCSILQKYKGNKVDLYNHTTYYKVHFIKRFSGFVMLN